MYRRGTVTTKFHGAGNRYSRAARRHSRQLHFASVVGSLAKRYFAPAIHQPMNSGAVVIIESALIT